jgi:hypothetical protein
MVFICIHENHRRPLFGVLCILWFGEAVVLNSVKNEDLTPLLSLVCGKMRAYPGRSAALSMRTDRTVREDYHAAEVSRRHSSWRKRALTEAGMDSLRRRPERSPTE